MALNYPGPYEVRIAYTVPIGGVTLSHTQRLNCTPDVEPSPGDLFSTIQIERRDAATVDLETAVEQWVDLLIPLMKTDVTFQFAELWKYTALSFESEYVSVFDLSTAGTNGGITQAGGQMIWTFRTLEGGVMKINLMESVSPPALSRNYTAQSAAEKAVVDRITGVANTWLARDTSMPFTHMQLHPGQNEVIWKKRFRS